MLWLSLVFFTLHNIEEYLTMPNFINMREHLLPGFAARFVKPVPDQVFVFMLLMVTLLAAFSIYLGTVSRPGSAGMFCAMIMVTGGLFINGLHHLGATILLQAYTPGVISSVLLLIPYSMYLCRKALIEKQVTAKLLAWSLVAGIAIFAPVILISRLLGILLLS